MLKVEDIDLAYGAALALRNVSLTAKTGEITCVLGRNGVGKTSLLRAITGRHPIKKGHILWEEAEISALPPYERCRRGIAFVPQGREIFPLLTVRENLETGFAPLKGKDRVIQDEIFELFPGAQVDASPARRRPLWRPTAAACHRTRAGHAAAPARAR